MNKLALLSNRTLYDFGPILLTDTLRQHVRCQAKQQDAIHTQGTQYNRCGIKPNRNTPAFFLAAGCHEKYFMLSDETIAEILINLESLAQFAQSKTPDQSKWDQVHIHARKCMDHVAGQLGCGIAVQQS